MDFDQIIAAINRKAGYRKDVVAAQASLEVAMTSAENGLNLPNGQTFMPWFLVSMVTTSTTTPGDYIVPLPADFLTGYEDGELWYAPTGLPLVQLEKLDFDNAVNIDNTAKLPLGSTPQGYALVGMNYRIIPQPQEAHDLLMIYMQRQSQAWKDVNIATDNAWFLHAPKLIIALAAMDLMEDKRDIKGMAIQERVAAKEAQSIYVQTIARAEANIGREMALN